MRPFFGDVPTSRVRSLLTTVAACLSLFAATAAGRVVTVDTEDNSSTAEDGRTSLLEALQGLRSDDIIRFAIPGAGPHRIKTPVGGYPVVTQDGVTIDGYSQPGAKPGTRDVLSGNDAVLAIYLDSTDDTSSGDPADPDRPSTRLPFPGYGPSERAILAVHGADHVRIKGLGFLARHTEGSRVDPSIYCVALVHGAEDCRVQGCRFGLDPDGTTLRGGASAVAGFRHRVENDLGEIVDTFSGGLVFGTDGDGVADDSEGNVTVDMHIALALELPRAKIAGNYFNMLPDGVTFVPVDRIRQRLLAVGRTGGDATVENIENGRSTEGTVIGTDGDGVGDAAERNIFNTAFHDHLIEFYGDAKDIVVAGNHFGVGVDGTTRAPAATGIAPGLLAFAGAGNVRIGSDGDGRSDALEGNRIVGIPGSRFVDAPPGLRILARRNIIVGCAFAGFPFADGDVNGLYSDLYSDVLADAFSPFPIIASTEGGFLVGTLPPVLTDLYPLSEVDVYLADPVSVTNGPALPGVYLTSFRDNSAVDLDPAADAFKVPLGGLAIPPGSRLVLAVGYSRNADGFGPAGVPVTGPLSAPVAATAVEVAAPVFTVQPVGAARPDGVAFTFTAAATGSGVIYQWKLDGRPVAGATNASYTIAETRAADSGDYTVVASNGGGSATSRTATLVVSVVPPAFTIQPVGATRLEGAAVAFTAAASGRGVSYQWRKDGKPVPGATDAVLAIAAVSAADAGDYTVVATNGGGSATSLTAKLTVVVVAPVFTAQPVGARRTVGASVSFTAAVDGIGVTYQWYLGGKPIPGATNAVHSIAAVTVTDAGDYTVVARNGGGAVTSQAAKLTVVVAPPVFTSQPVDETRPLGSAVVFTASAEGTDVTYQWRFGGRPIAGATGPSHTIAAVTVASAGFYTVVASNSGGTVFSRPARLTVLLPAPVFTVQPVGATRVAGSSVAFTAAVEGIGVTYQWERDGTPVPGATKSGLEIAEVTPADAGSYAVVAKNSGGSVKSRPALLVVTVPAPVITLQPVGGARRIGTAIAFTVAAQGTGMSYQWRRDGQPIPGAVNSGYVITAVDAADAGDYTVVVGNTGGSVTSEVARLTVVVPAPVFTAQPAGATRRVGSPMLFTAAADGDGVTYQWMLDGKAIAGATNATFGIAAVKSGDSGDYSVVASNGGGSVTSQVAKLSVVSLSPIFTTEPVGATRLEGDRVVFTAAAEGDGVTYQWTLGGKPVPGATSGTYTIAAVAVADAGDYAVVASNSGGAVTSRPAALKVVPSADVRPGLVAHLKFDDSYTDASGNGSDARGKGTKNQPTFEAGIIGKGVRITNKRDGTADAYVSLGYPVPLRFGDGSAGTDFSVSMWAKVISQADDQALISNKDWSNIANRGWGLFSQEDGAFRVNVASANGTVADRPKAGLKDGAWHLLTVTVSRKGSVDSFVDGLPVSSSRVPVLGDIDTDSLGLSVNIGQDGTGTYTDFGSAEIDMVVDDLGLWRRKLEAPEVLAIYLRGLAGKSLDQPPAPKPLVLTAPSATAAGLVLGWSGGTGPFIVQAKQGLTDAWSDLRTTTDRTAVLPLAAQSGFLRIVDAVTNP